MLPLGLLLFEILLVGVSDAAHIGQDFLQKLDFGAQRFLYHNPLLELIDQPHASAHCSTDQWIFYRGLHFAIAGWSTFASTLAEDADQEQSAGVEVHVGSAEGELEQQIVEEDFGLALVQRDLQLSNQSFKASRLFDQLLSIENYQVLSIIATCQVHQQTLELRIGYETGGVRIVTLPDTDELLDVVLLDRCTFEVDLSQVRVDQDCDEQAQKHLCDHYLEKQEERDGCLRIATGKRITSIELDLFVSLIFEALERD